LQILRCMILLKVVFAYQSHSGVGIHMLTPNRGRNCRLTVKIPRFVIIGFTLNGEVITNNLSNLKVHLNSKSYPYDKLNVDLSKNQYAHLYEMYTITTIFELTI